jgi:1,2-diacylglycerol 3-beta-galactosyltransferase
VEQAREMGIPSGKIRRVSGMILRPNFYDPIPTDRREERERLGLDADLPTGLVLFGGQGAGVMKDIARRLQGLEGRLQLMFLCGRNVRLAGQIRDLESRIPIHVEEFTAEVPYFMSLSDFLIGKPGPGSISEAIAMKVPVIVERNAWTLPQERFNCDWVLENRLGLVVSSFREIAVAVERLLAPGQLSAYRDAAARIENRAVFEIPDILEEILESATSFRPRLC